MGSDVVIAFGALIGGLVAYLAGFALLQALRRRPPAEDAAADASSGNKPAAPERGPEDPPAAQSLLESTPC